MYFLQNNSTLCTKSVAEFSYLQSRQLSNLKCLNSRNYVNGFRHQRNCTGLAKNPWGLSSKRNYPLLREHGKWLDPEIFDGEILKRTVHHR